MIDVPTDVFDLELEAYVRGEPSPVPVRLRDYTGSWVVLFFYPRDFTFVCPTELRVFAELQADFEAENAVLLAASTDSYFCHRAWFESDERLRGVVYPVIADTAHRLSRALDVPLDDGAAARATFVLDPEGVIRHASVSDPSVGRNPGEVLRVVRALRTGELCPVNWHPGEATLSAAA